MNRNYIELKKKKVKDLKALCKEHKIKKYSKLKKKELVNILFEFLYPNEDKVIKIEKTPPPPPNDKSDIEPTPPPTPQPKPKEIIIEEIIDHPLKIKLDVLEDIKTVEPKTTKPIEFKKDFNEEYEKILQENIKKLKEKKEKKEKKKIKKILIDLDDNDYVITINNLIKKLYN